MKTILLALLVVLSIALPANSPRSPTNDSQSLLEFVVNDFISNLDSSYALSNDRGDDFHWLQKKSKCCNYKAITLKRKGPKKTKSIVEETSDGAWRKPGTVLVNMHK
jgi:hypothetical protein